MVPDWVWVVALAILALTLRLVYVWQVGGLSLINPVELDPAFYYEWARAIAAGDWLGKDPFVQSPLYAYLLATLLLVVGENIVRILIAQSLIGCGTVLLVYLAGRRLFGHAHGLLAGCALALYAPFIFYEGMVMKTFLAPFLTVLLVLLFDRARDAAAPLGEGRAARWFVITGAVYGLATLDRDNFILLAPVLAGLALVLGGGLCRRGFQMAGAFTLGTILFIAPVTLRNWAVSHEFVLLTTGGGEVFFIGNNEYANGLYVPPPFVRPDPLYEHADFVARASEITGQPLSPMQSSWFWFREGMKFIVDQPLAWIRLLGLKMLHFWNHFELPDNLNYEVMQQFSPLLAGLNARFPPAGILTPAIPFGGRWIPSPIHLFLTFGTLAPLGLAGIVLTRERWRRLLPIYVLLFGYVATVLLFFNFSRFRVPVVPILALFAAPTLFALGRTLQRIWVLAVAVAAQSGAILARARALRPSVPQTVTAALLFLSLFVMNMELPRGLVPAIERFLIVGNAHYHMHQPDLALQKYAAGAHLLGEAPPWLETDDRLFSHLGVTREELQRELQAEALARGPQFKGIRIGIQHGLGIALLMKAEEHMARGMRTSGLPLIDRAIGQFEAVLRIAPSYLLSMRMLGKAHVLRGDNSTAIDWLRKAADLWPDDMRTRLELAEALFNGGDARAALTELDAALRREESLSDIELAQVYYNRGVALSQGLSEPGRALFAFEKALELNPDLLQAPQTRAKILELRAGGYQPLPDRPADEASAPTPPP
jgi:4-amino-4-deoxy-L-arabinose transferase-like glycosyltransferase